jgi:uncharacterized membrane protein
MALPLIGTLISRVVQPIVTRAGGFLIPKLVGGFRKFATNVIGKLKSIPGWVLTPLSVLLSFFGRQLFFVLVWISDTFKGWVSQWISFTTRVRFSVLFEILKPFFVDFLPKLFKDVYEVLKNRVHYFIIVTLVPIVYAVLDSWGFNLFVEIVRYFLLAFSKVIGFVIDLIFGLVDFEAIVTNFNEALDALPSCVLELMFAVGLNECLNSLVLTCVMLITVRFILFVWRR